MLKLIFIVINIDILPDFCSCAIVNVLYKTNPPQCQQHCGGFVGSGCGGMLFVVLVVIERSVVVAVLIIY